MRKLLKNELSRAFCNRIMAGVIAFEFILVISHVVIYGLIPLEVRDSLVNVVKDPYRAPYSVFRAWMGGDAFNMPGFLHAMLLPLLAVLPYGASYFDDVKGGFVKNVYLRSKRLPFLKAKYCAVFLSGCAVAAFPLCLDFLLMLMIYPALLPQLSSSIYPIFATNMWYEVFYTNPFCYVAGFILINTIFGGLVAVLGLALSFLADYKYIILMMPFLFQMFLYALGNLMGQESISPVFYLQAGSGMASAPIILVEFIVLALCGGGLFFWRGLKDDVF